MKYIRTKDGRILKECNLKEVVKQTCITIINKRDNKSLTQIMCDNLEGLEDIIVGEYCMCHKINPKEIRYERIVLLNKILKQADTIEELYDVIVSVKKHEGTVVDFDILWSFLNWREELGEEIAEGAEIYGAIWTDKGLIYVAKMKGILPNGGIDWELL